MKLLHVHRTLQRENSCIADRPTEQCSPLPLVGSYYAYAMSMWMKFFTILYAIMYKYLYYLQTAVIKFTIQCSMFLSVHISLCCSCTARGCTARYQVKIVQPV